MNKHEITCKLEADTRRLADIFGTFKTNDVNIRKIELMESLIRHGQKSTQRKTFYLHLEMDYRDDLPQRIAELF